MVYPMHYDIYTSPIGMDLFAFVLVLWWIKQVHRWFVPELVLVRSSKEDCEKYRLDNMLLRKALDGVKVGSFSYQF